MTELENAIILDVVENVRYRAKRFYDVTLTENAKTKIRNFLQNQTLNNGAVRVVFKKNVPHSYISTKISTGELDLNLSYGKNNKPEEYPNILFVFISKKDTGKFKNFWINRHLPMYLLPEVFENIILSKEVKIEVFKNLTDWTKKCKEESSKLILIGKGPHKKAKKLLNHIPIGYVISSENRIVLSIPNQENGYYTFH